MGWWSNLDDYLFCRKITIREKKVKALYNFNSACWEKEGDGISKPTDLYNFFIKAAIR